MGDPFSISAGIVGVFSLSLQITQTVSKFGLDWKDAPKDIVTFKQELEALSVTLTEIHNRFIHNRDYETAFEGSSSVLLSHLKANNTSKDSIKSAFETSQTQLLEAIASLKIKETGHRLGWKRLKEALLSDRTRDAVSTLHRQCGIVNQLLSIDTVILATGTNVEIKQLRKEHQAWHTADENRDILRWLSQLGFEEKHRGILSNLHPGTGQWLLRSDEFKSWQNCQLDVPANLWCPGMPGAGKSVLAALVVDHLQKLFNQEDVSVLYIYCDYKDREAQTDRNLLASLATQSITQQSDLPSRVKALYSHSRNKATPPSHEEYRELLLSSMKHFRRTFIVVDALDEHLSMAEDENNAEIPLLTDILNIQRSLAGRCSMLITSRELDSISAQLDSRTRLEIRAKDEDVRSYVTSKIKTSFCFAKYVQATPDFAEEIIESLVEKAQGMFLLPRLHLDRLGNQTSVRNVRKELKALPVRIDDTYQDAMARIQNQGEEYAKLALRAFSWISGTKRPLSVEELQHAVSVELGDRDLEDESLVPPTLITSVCAGLVSIDSETNTFRLVHFTVEEFFQKKGHQWVLDADKIIAETCLTYLLFNTFGQGICKKHKDLWARSKKYALLNYAGQNWGDHATPALAHVEELGKEFLGHNIKVAVSEQAEDYYSDEWPEWMPGLNLLARHGYKELAEFWIRSGADTDARDEMGTTALMEAVIKDNPALARLLIDHDADVNAKDYRNRTALMKFSCAGAENLEILELLLKAGANVNDCDERGRSALMDTIFDDSRVCDHLELLLNAGADVNAKDGNGNTCLHGLDMVAESQVSKYIDLLLHAGADIEARDDYGYTPTLRFLLYGDLHIAKLLMARGAKIDFHDLKKRPPILTNVHDGGLFDMKKKLSGQCAGPIDGLEIPLPAVRDVGLAEILLRDNVHVDFAYYPNATVMMITSPSSTVGEVVGALIGAGVQAVDTDEEEPIASVGGVEQDIEKPNEHQRWFSFSTWQKSQNLMQRPEYSKLFAGNDKPREYSEHPVRLLILWNMSPNGRKRASQILLLGYDSVQDLKGFAKKCVFGYHLNSENEAETGSDDVWTDDVKDEDDDEGDDDDDDDGDDDDDDGDDDDDDDDDGDDDDDDHSVNREDGGDVNNKAEKEMRKSQLGS